MMRQGRMIHRIKTLIRLMLFALGLMISLAVPAQSNNKINELNQKIADITLLNQQLADRCAQVVTIRNALKTQKNTYEAEISVLAKSLQLAKYQDAAQNRRIRYNLELLQTINAYLDELDIKMLFYQNGRNKLQYLQQSAEDDIKMIATVNDMKIEALITQISLVVNRYLPEAHIIQIDTTNIVQPSAQTIWEQIYSRIQG